MIILFLVNDLQREGSQTQVFYLSFYLISLIKKANRCDARCSSSGRDAMMILAHSRNYHGVEEASMGAQ
jgi:hypothetical protein